MVCGIMVKLPRDTSADIATLTVRVPRSLVSDIDTGRKARAVRVPRNTWILEAVVEKLDRERHCLRNEVGHGEDDGQE